MKSLDEQILGYFKEHPHASDTIEGITQWWFLRGCTTPSSDQVRRALERLVSSGFLSVSAEPSGRAHYKLIRGANGNEV